MDLRKERERDIFQSVLMQCYADFRIRHQSENYKELENVRKIVELSVRSRYADSKEDCEEFLNRLAYCEDKEKEDSYIGGVMDGIRLMRFLFAIA